MTLTQPELPVAPRFDGSDYVPARDDVRLTGQLRRVWNLMRDGRKRSLAAIAETTGDPEASVSAQLRHLRKPRFGAHDVRKLHMGGGHYLYWIQTHSTR